MRDIMPLLIIVVNCCVGPLIIFSLGVLVGRHGPPIVLNKDWLSRNNRTRQQESSRVLMD